MLCLQWVADQEQVSGEGAEREATGMCEETAGLRLFMYNDANLCHGHIASQLGRISYTTARPYMRMRTDDAMVTLHVC